jgi:hypothetical protein
MWLEADISVLTRLIFAAYFLEAGLILVVAPWSAFWDRNVFARSEAIAALLSNPFVRGAVSGVGIVTALAGLAELAGAFFARKIAEQTAEAVTEPPPDNVPPQ